MTDVPLNDEVVRARISALTRAKKFPKLDDDDLDLLVGYARRSDQYGRVVTDANWIPTYNIGYAVGKGWEMKAGACVANYDIADADQRLMRSQVFKACMAMAEKYKGNVVGTTTVRAPQRSDTFTIPGFTPYPLILPTEAEQESG